ncbi:MAG: hypothetical protein ACQEP1_01325 [Nanobdellota archaeon]
MKIKDKASELYEDDAKEARRDTEPYAMWSFVLSIAPFFVFFIPFVNFIIPLLPLASIVLGIVSLNRDFSEFSGRGFSIAGIIISSIEIILAVLILIVLGHPPIYLLNSFV